MKDQVAKSAGQESGSKTNAEGMQSAAPPGFQLAAGGASNNSAGTLQAKSSSPAGPIQRQAIVQRVAGNPRTDFPREAVVQRPGQSIPGTVMDTGTTSVPIPAGTRVHLLSEDGTDYVARFIDSHGTEHQGKIPQEDVDDIVTSEIERNMEGSRMTWVPSSPGVADLTPHGGPVRNLGTNNFATWALAATEGAAPAVAAVTTINCWEMILLAANRAGVLPWSRIHATYTSRVPATTIAKLFNPDPAVQAEGNREFGAFTDGLLISLMTRGGLRRYDTATKTPQPRRGDIVFFNRAAHVTLATGSGDGIHTFWPPPNTAFTNGGTVDAVKQSTIADLYNWMDANRAPLGMGPLDPINVEIGTPAW